jgi:phospholipid/cholesterol/gamma-HCH transport system permease protein
VRRLLTPSPGQRNDGGVDKQTGSEAPLPPGVSLLAAPLPRSYLHFVGSRLIELGELIRGLGAFTLITLGVMLTKWNQSARVIHPLIRAQVDLAGVRLLPIISFAAFILGFVAIGQTVSLLSQVGATQYAGTAMVIVVFRELGPLVAALLVLARVGTATVIELGQMRSLGEIEALEALGIDPIHYLVVPRVIGLALSIFALTVYFILIALFSGYLFAFLQDVPLMPGTYIDQIASALRWEDFVLLALKTFVFGSIIAMVTCYQGLGKPLRQEDLAKAATRAVMLNVELCILLDAVFMVYLLL